jgi:hypothetical protein
MDLPSIFESLAEGGITLAGFSAVFRAFGGKDDPDGFSELRLRAVIEGGLLVALLSYLPATLAGAGLSPLASWKTASILGAIWLMIRAYISINIFRSAKPLPALLPLAFALILLGVCSYLSTVFGMAPWPAQAGYLISQVTTLSYVGVVFLAQFRVERAV